MQWGNLEWEIWKVQKTINKGGIILGQVADSLIKIKHSKDMTAGDMKNAVMPLIQMCTDGLAFLANGDSFLNQTCRNYITSVLPRHMSELGKKVPEDSDWLFGDNIVSRINQIKARQKALRSDGFKNSKNLQGFSKTQRIDNMGTTRNSPGKDRIAATTSKASKGNSIIRRGADTKTSKQIWTNYKMYGWEYRPIC